MKYNLEEVPELLADIAGAMGADIAGMDSLNAGKTAVDEMQRLSKKIGLSQRLRDLGVEVDTLKECSELSMSDGSIIYNPKIIMDAEEVFAVYEEAY
jgi:alcohol dehydrogenase class IV